MHLAVTIHVPITTTAIAPALLHTHRRPPELITEGILTKAADVYAFGVITWEIYVGRCGCDRGQLRIAPDASW